jgi:hypothetical protein
MKFEQEKTWQRPATFQEYWERFPDWHIRWLGKRYPPHSNPDFEDVVQHLLLEALRKQRVEKYDPAQCGGKDTPGLFFHWMGEGYARDLAGLIIKRRTPKRWAAEPDVRLDGTRADALLMGGISKLGVPASSAWRSQAWEEGMRPYASARLQEFADFVGLHRPAALPDVWKMCRDEGLTDGQRERIYGLARHFVKGTRPNRPRRGHSAATRAKMSAAKRKKRKPAN